MKKLNILKTIELICAIIFAVVCIILVFFDKDMMQEMAVNSKVRIAVTLLWVFLAGIFVFLFLDFSFITKYKYDYYLLQDAVHSDPLSGLPNRYSCDTIIEKYIDQNLPEHVGCIMVDLTNLYDINKELNRTTGNKALKDFSNILLEAADLICFVGRNGGNKFLAFFEDCTEDTMDLFLSRMKTAVDKYNANSSSFKLQYAYGAAFNKVEKKEHITELLTLSNSRISSGK